ncbi:MAG: DinB family protein [Acidobacteriota bacterium]|nr:DinB family protein [Blastocatellia bacterium]MDW8412539.1 DinB family protein [Acidobacteriota bacterium]
MQDFFNNWDRIHAQSTKVMAVAPAEKFDWRPVESAMTLGELMRHLPSAEALIVELVSGIKINTDLENKNSAQELVAEFDRIHEAAKEIVATLDDKTLEESVTLGPKTLQKKMLLYTMLEHEIHHRGQLYTYIRIAGVVPPPLFG